MGSNGTWGAEDRLQEHDFEDLVPAPKHSGRSRHHHRRNSEIRFEVKRWRMLAYLALGAVAFETALLIAMMASGR